MSNLTNTTSNSIAMSAKNYAIFQCTITTNAGEEIELKDVVHDVKISEKIYQSAMIVDIFILDSINLMHELKISGNESIHLIIGRIEPGDEAKGFDLKLYISEIKDYSQPTPSSRAYTLQCVSKHVYLNNKKLLNRPFKNNATRVITSIIRNDLKSEISTYSKNESKDIIQGIFPNISPLQAISWLLRNSYDNSTPIYFYETAKDGIVINSYNQIVNHFKEPYIVFNNFPFYKHSASDNKGAAIFNEEKRKIIKVMSQINLSKHRATLKGSFKSKLNKIDISTKQVTDNTYTYSNEKRMNEYSPITESMKIDDLSIATGFQAARQHYISLNENAFTASNYHAPTDNTILKAQASQHNLDTIRQEIVIAGDFDLTCGMIVELELIKNADITREMVNDDDFKDDVLSGKHLVTSVLHHFSKTGYTQNLVLKKDSFIKEV